VPGLVTNIHITDLAIEGTLESLATVLCPFTHLRRGLELVHFFQLAQWQCQLFCPWKQYVITLTSLPHMYAAKTSNPSASLTPLGSFMRERDETMERYASRCIWRHHAFALDPDRTINEALQS
jgi:hypothetical protein